MLTSPVGLRSEKGCVGDAQQKLKSTDTTSRQRGRPTSTNRNCLKKNNQKENGKNWSRVPDECLTPGRTGRLTVGRNITLTIVVVTGVDKNCSSEDILQAATDTSILARYVQLSSFHVRTSLTAVCFVSQSERGGGGGARKRGGGGS
jgi:hypothetical protein